MSTLTNEEIARELVRRILQGDPDEVAALYADGFTVWRNTDNRTMGREQALKILGFLHRLRDLRYEDVRVQSTPAGFVQQHIMRCTAPGGEAVEAHVCMIGTVKDGKLVHVAEYMDSAHMAPLMK